MITKTGKKPRVSIGMPVFNGERYVTTTLDSLLAQTFEDFELIICDNASQDHTEQICRSYAAKDARIRYVRNATNLGAARNYRRSFALSSGEYFRWANCDDLFAPESLARCVDVLDHYSEVILTYPKTKLIDERGEIISEYEDGLQLQSPKASDRFVQVYQNLGLVNAIYGLVRSETLRKTALIGNFIGGDIPLVAELALYGKFWEIPDFLFYRRFHPGASSSFKKDSELQEFFDPMTKGKAPLTKWKHLRAYCRALIHAPLRPMEKMRIGYFLLRATIRMRDDLVSEILRVKRQVV